MSEQGAEVVCHPPQAPAVIWHDVECGGYAADQPLWRELARSLPGPILEAGCGTGRIALDLAKTGYRVDGVDSDRDLVAALRARSNARNLHVGAHVQDARQLDLGSRYRLVLAPMQLVQLLGGQRGRAAFLHCVTRHLEPDGLVALALASPLEGANDGACLSPAPDMRELDGWTFSSLPLVVRSEGDGARLAVDRLRQAVSPDGQLHEAVHTLTLDGLEAEQLEAEAQALGFAVEPRRLVPETDAHVSSTVVMLRLRHDGIGLAERG